MNNYWNTDKINNSNTWNSVTTLYIYTSWIFLAVSNWHSPLPHRVCVGWTFWPVWLLKISDSLISISEFKMLNALCRRRRARSLRTMQSLYMHCIVWLGAGGQYNREYSVASPGGSTTTGGPRGLGVESWMEGGREEVSLTTKTFVESLVVWFFLSSGHHVDLIFETSPNISWTYTITRLHYGPCVIRVICQNSFATAVVKAKKLRQRTRNLRHCTKG